MPPISPTPSQTQNQIPSVTIMPKKKGSAGATVGIIIIVLLMIFGGLYFWGARLNASNNNAPLPFIPGDPTATN